MQQLHLVGFTTDLEGLIFSARKGTKSGGYFVVLDDRLRATVEDALRLREGETAGADDRDRDGDGSSGRPRRPRPESTLSPREMQARLRAGSSVAEVAAEAGVDEEWVSRFAVPILAEQAQVVARARQLSYVKPRLGESAHPLGVAVRWNLADKGIRLLDDDYDASWSAYNLRGASWIVRFQYVSRQKRSVAEWEVDLRENELYTRNRAAAELGYLDPSRRRRRPPVLEPPAGDVPPRPVDPPRPTATARPERAPVDVARSAGPVKVAAPRKPAARKASATTARAAKNTAAKKAAAKKGKGAKATKASRAGKAGKATTSRRAAPAKRGRAQKAAGKRRGPGHAAAAAEAPPRSSPPPLVADPIRPSHLARPPSPMPAARRAAVVPFGARPAPLPPPRPTPRPAPPPPRPPAPEAEPPPAAQEPAAVVVRRPPPPPRAVGRDEARGNGNGKPAARERQPAPTPAPEPPSPDRRLAERLATQPARRARPDRPAGTTSAEPVWHGPGSGEPAPSVRIRADLAAGTIRPTEQPPRRRRRPVPPR